MTAPNLEERFAAAAFRILTDDLPHSLQAQRWATGYLRFAARGRGTAFQRHVRTARAHAHFAQQQRAGA
jgi:hypothetical protein